MPQFPSLSVVHCYLKDCLGPSVSGSTLLYLQLVLNKRCSVPPDILIRLQHANEVYRAGRQTRRMPKKKWRQRRGRASLCFKSLFAGSASCWYFLYRFTQARLILQEEAELSLCEFAEFNAFVFLSTFHRLNSHLAVVQSQSSDGVRSI